MVTKQDNDDALRLGSSQTEENVDEGDGDTDTEIDDGWTNFLDELFDQAAHLTREQRKEHIYSVLEPCKKYQSEMQSLLDKRKREFPKSVGKHEPAIKKKKKDKPKDEKKFKEWTDKLEDIMKQKLPDIQLLQPQDIEKQFGDTKQKHISINYRFITEKKDNHSEQVRFTYRKFFDRYPKLFYFFSYWTLNGKFKLIKSVMEERPDIKDNVTNIPKEYKDLWKEEE